MNILQAESASVLLERVRQHLLVSAKAGEWDRHALADAALACTRLNIILRAEMEGKIICQQCERYYFKGEPCPHCGLNVAQLPSQL